MNNSNPIAPEGSFHMSDRHAATNPWAHRFEEAEKHGFLMHDASATGDENAGCGGFGAVHMAQRITLMSGMLSVPEDAEIEDAKIDALCVGLEGGCKVSDRCLSDRRASPSTTADSGDSPLGVSADVEMNPTQGTGSVAETVRREVARMRLARGIVDPSIPLAQPSEPPLGPDSTEPLLAIKSGIADKSMVLEERTNWVKVGDHPNINGLIESWDSIIPAHTSVVKGEMTDFEEKPAVHFVTPWLSADLHDHIHTGHKDPTGQHHAKQITREEMTKIAYDVAVALHHIHQNCGLAHRDVKPANILMTSHGVAQLTDFGISAEPNITAENRMRCDACCIGKHHFPNHVGTAHYSSPQQVSYRLRVLELIPGEMRTRERRIKGTTINPSTGVEYQVCIALANEADVRREQARWYNYGFETYLPPGPDFVFEGQLNGGCQASGKMDVWSLGTLILESITGHAIYDFPKSEHNIMRHWIKLGVRPNDKEARTVFSADGKRVTMTEYEMRKQISTIKGALEYTEERRFDALELAYRLATVGLQTDEELAAKGIDPNNLGGNPEDLLDKDGQLPVRREALEWDNAVHARWAHKHPNASSTELKRLYAEDVARYKKVEIAGPNSGLNLVSKSARSFPVQLVKIVRPVEVRRPQLLFKAIFGF